MMNVWLRDFRSILAFKKKEIKDTKRERERERERERDKEQNAWRTIEQFLTVFL